jgi:hypothetical protein
MPLLIALIELKQCLVWFESQELGGEISIASNLYSNPNIAGFLRLYFLEYFKQYATPHHVPPIGRIDECIKDVFAICPYCQTRDFRKSTSRY